MITITTTGVSAIVTSCSADNVLCVVKSRGYNNNNINNNNINNNNNNDSNNINKIS